MSPELSPGPVARPGLSAWRLGWPHPEPLRGTGSPAVTPRAAFAAKASSAAAVVRQLRPGHPDAGLRRRRAPSLPAMQVGRQSQPRGPGYALWPGCARTRRSPPPRLLRSLRVIVTDVACGRIHAERRFRTRFSRRDFTAEHIHPEQSLWRADRSFRAWLSRNSGLRAVVPKGLRAWSGPDSRCPQATNCRPWDARLTVRRSQLPCR